MQLLLLQDEEEEQEEEEEEEEEEVWSPSPLPPHLFPIGCSQDKTRPPPPEAPPLPRRFHLRHQTGRPPEGRRA